MAVIVHASTALKVDQLPIDVDLQDKEKLQRGAKLFMNYCSGCHSLRYMRYSRMAKDLGLTTFDGELDENLLVSNLIFTRAKIHDPIEIAMPPVDSREWFGVEPPDLSLSARKHSASWLYTYLKSFYEDKSRPFGTNNLLIPGVAMPNVLAPLSGRVVAVKGGEKNESSPISHLLRVKEGEMTAHQFDSAVEDLVTFLVYVGEPVKLVRYRTGGLVLAFLFIFLIVVYQLKKNYWRDLHS
ncbi:MAG: cytochrome c1 [Legionella sp.]|nr:cytochrome c1 [Legionella sp.]